ETPDPRLSKQMSRLNVARRRRKRAIDGSSHMTSRLVPHHGMKTRSSGPSPTTWYATLPSLLLAYRVSGYCMASCIVGALDGRRLLLQQEMTAGSVAVDQLECGGEGPARRVDGMGLQGAEVGERGVHVPHDRFVLG